MADGSSKTNEAFRTIGELSRDTGIAQHILRYWETRFPQLRPITRAGNRRYYRPEDIALVRRIDSLLNQRGFTIKGAQQTLANEGVGHAVTASTPLAVIRDQLARALAED